MSMQHLAAKQKKFLHFYILNLHKIVKTKIKDLLCFISPPKRPLFNPSSTSNMWLAKLRKKFCKLCLINQNPYVTKISKDSK